MKTSQSFYSPSIYLILAQLLVYSGVSSYSVEQIKLCSPVIIIQILIKNNINSRSEN